MTDGFVQDATAQANWKSFANRNQVEFETLGQIVSELREFLREPLQRARSGDDFTARWNPGGRWK
jgi:hypothetical protein